MLNALFEYQFLQHALLSSILASIVCGIIGVIIIEKNLVMMSGGIAHTSYGGVGFGYLTGVEPIIGALLFSILAALGIGMIRRKRMVRSDVIIGLFWSLGMALGIFFITLMPGYPPDISSYLFGNILSVTRADLILMGIITGFVLLVFIMFFNTWKAYFFDEEFAAIIGIPVICLENLLLIMIAVSVVALIRVVGIILVLALLTAPAAIAGLLAAGFRRRIMVAVILSMLFCMTGLWISYITNSPSGASIVLISAFAYLLVYIIKQLPDRIRGTMPKT